MSLADYILIAYGLWLLVTKVVPWLLGALFGILNWMDWNGR
jgi:hypothetical protein